MGDSKLSDDPITVPIEVQFRDIDAFGLVNNAVYLSYLESARIKYWLSMRGKCDLQDLNYVIAHVEIDYISPSHLGEILQIGVRVSSMGKKSFTFEFCIVGPDPEHPGKDRLVARARSVQVLYNQETRQSMLISDALRTQIEKFEGRPLE